ncbi:MAG: hypothetical protein WCH04_14175 [Gammaproteobacteria bacterium]
MPPLRWQRMGSTTEIFFRPEETARERVTLPAPLYNRCRLLLARCPRPHVFVPIRTMQYQAVIDSEEIIFVDNQGYAVRDGRGGRLIVLAWKVALGNPRESLTEPVPIEILYYGRETHDTHRRLMSEFPQALSLLESRQQRDTGDCLSATILPFTVRN